MSGRSALLGAAVAGAALRWALSVAVDADPSGLGWATLTANVLGCLLLGVVAHDLVGPDRAHARLDGWRAAAGVGFCGGLTTFSTLAVHVAVAVDDGRVDTALADLGVSIALGIAALAAGVAAGHRLHAGSA